MQLDLHLVLPIDLMWPGSSMRRLSRSGPPAALTAAATSPGVTEPNRRPPVPARAVSETLQRLELGLDLLGVPEVADLPGRTGPLDRADLLLAALGPGDREALRQQVVTAVAVLDLDDVAGRAEAGDTPG